MQLARRLVDGITYLFFPRLCAGCNHPLVRSEEVICIRCESLIPFTNYHQIDRNETAMRLWGRCAFSHATSLSYFAKEGLLQHLIHNLKYAGKTEAGFYLGKHLGRAIKEQYWNIDLIIPVPLHRKKEQKRGYNQSLHICLGIAEILQVPVDDSSVQRNRFTESQTDKNREERLQNVRDAFTVVNPEKVKNKHVLLVDDVLTTGATMETCANCILKASDTQVSIATLAIAG